MCGINGFNFLDNGLLSRMNASISYRGPDGSGELCEEGVSLGHRRLAIIDTSSNGKQPMLYSREDRECVIVYNGEIYNYIEVREELKKRGHVFRTSSDTEVILAAYQEYGYECVNKFNGMWAFAIYDKKKNELFLSRDRLGVKPLFYYFKDGRFIFSSELKGILAHEELKINSFGNLNHDSIGFYFSCGFVPSPMSIFKNVFKLERAHNLVFDLKLKKIKKLWRYYEVPEFRPIDDKKRLVKEGRKILRDSVRLRMRSDVPVGAFLSGGLDSSSVVSMMKEFTELEKLNTFSVGFRTQEYDETKYVDIVTDYVKTRHHHYYFEKKDLKDQMNLFFETYDEPFWDYSAFSMLFLSEKAKDYVKVMLSGDGGDEIFAGYNSHLAGKRLELIKKIPLPLRRIGSKIPAKKDLNSFVSPYLLKEAFRLSLELPEHFHVKSLPEDRFVTKEFEKWSEEKLRECIELGGGSLSEGLRLYDLLYNTLQDNFLQKVDKASMVYGLEVRSPYLDFRFVEFAQKIPSSMKVDLLKTKKLMREIISDILPKEIVNRGKQGFEPPLDKWIQDEEFSGEIPNYLEELRNTKAISEELYHYYKKKVLISEDKFFAIQKIKLLLFYNWYKRWVTV